MGKRKIPREDGLCRDFEDKKVLGVIEIDQKFSSKNSCAAS